MFLVRVAKEFAIPAGRSKGEERGVSLLDGREISIACLGIPGLYRRELRQRDQDLVNSLDDLLLLRGGKHGKPDRLVPHFDFARAAQIDLIVGLDRDRWQKRNRDQQK
jgi:hypothetical protein